MSITLIAGALSADADSPSCHEVPFHVVAFSVRTVREVPGPLCVPRLSNLSWLKRRRKEGAKRNDGRIQKPRDGFQGKNR